MPDFTRLVRRAVEAARLAERYALPFAEHDPLQPTYLRIGPWTKAERSGNYARGDIEAGLSAYDISHSGAPLVPPEGEWAAIDMADRMMGKQPKFYVQGMHVGIGNEGEPLLSKVRVVSPLWKPPWEE